MKRTHTNPNRPVHCPACGTTAHGPPDKPHRKCGGRWAEGPPPQPAATEHTTALTAVLL